MFIYILNIFTHISLITVGRNRRAGYIRHLGGLILAPIDIFKGNLAQKDD